MLSGSEIGFHVELCRVFAGPVTYVVCVNDRLNVTVWNTTNATTATPTRSTTTPEEVVLLPDKGEVEKEHHYSMTIFFILLVLGKLATLVCQLFVRFE